MPWYVWPILDPFHSFHGCHKSRIRITPGNRQQQPLRSLIRQASLLIMENTPIVFNTTKRSCYVLGCKNSVRLYWTKCFKNYNVLILLTGAKITLDAMLITNLSSDDETHCRPKEKKQCSFFFLDSYRI